LAYCTLRSATSAAHEALCPDKRHRGFRASATGGGLHHAVELRDAGVEIGDRSPRQRDLLHDRRDVVIDSFLCGDLMLQVRLGEEAVATDRSVRHQCQNHDSERRAEQ
jgi:hypothetical protein